MVTDVIKGFLILFFILVPIERIFALHEQKIFRQAWTTDAIYYFLGYFIGRGTQLAISVLLIGHIFKGLLNTQLQILVASQPLLLQFIEAVLISDIGYYTAHKLNHTVPWLWKFHAVHHSVEQLDWLATVRVHPIDQVFTKMFQVIPLYILGFTKETFAGYIIFSAFIAFFIHANIKLKFRWFKWFVATPEFHHWHHSIDKKAYNKNFAAQLPFLDLIFGTLYMPAGKMPERYGISERIPSGYIGQILHPFRTRKNINF